MYKYATSIGVDVGQTMIRSAVIRYGGEVLTDLTLRHDPVKNSDELISHIISAVSKTRQEAYRLKVNPLCVGIAARGFVDYKKGIILGPDQGVKGWENIRLSKIVNAETGLPAFIDNDAKLMAIAEHHNGAAKSYDNVVFVTLRSGIGGAIIIDGKLYRGYDNAGGEIGQMSLDVLGQFSDKGIRGSFEYFASSVALIRNYLALSGQINEKGVKSNDRLRARDVFELSYRGDKPASKAVADNANYVGAGLANLISIFAPDIIILGGGMAMAKDVYLDMIRESAYSNSLGFCRKNVKIIRAKLGFHASLQGAGIFALTRLDGKHI